MAVGLQLYIGVLLMTSFAGTGSGFLLSTTPCEAPLPCTCMGGWIDCENKSLLDVPIFAAKTDYRPDVTVNLNANRITTIHHQAFKALGALNTTQFIVQLDGNNLTSIDLNAFSGVENITHTLYLMDNKLTNLPDALGKLHNLKYLYMSGNPIKSLDSTVMSVLGWSLKSFSIDLKYVRSWPVAFNMFMLLDNLSLGFIQDNHLAHNVFDNIASTLTVLTIYKSNLYRIPSAICHLQNLQYLYFYSNSLLETNSLLFEPCQKTHPNLFYLMLYDNGLTSFPRILESFPALTSLSLSNNNLTFIPSSAIPYNSSINEVYLRNNSLTRVPYALTELKKLKFLYMSNNKINTIEENDFAGVKNLYILNIDDNPLEYVAPNAFKNNDKLEFIDIQNSKLTTIPEAFASSRLRFIDFIGNTVTCSCDMSYLKGWNITVINGNCNNPANNTLKEFILNFLPHCP